jgi:U4/U6 small nuclear ribonucleoprotein PRP3
LIPPPEPRLTLKNFIRVLGDQAYVDPSQMEQKVLEQVQARQKAHIERNESRKLTREQRREKRMRKLQEDTQATGIHVALFYVKDMSHPYHRAKVDLNAQQFNLSGGVVECINPQISCIIVEGGPKAINKYIRLMLVRMKWTGTDDDEDEDEEEVGGDQMIGDDGVMMKKKHKFNKDNKCELVWTGIATKRFFKGFVFQACETSVEASKILRAKGVGHFWEQLLTHASGSGESFRLKLADDSDDGDDDDDDDDDDDEEEDDDDEKDKMQIDG